MSEQPDITKAFADWADLLDKDHPELSWVSTGIRNRLKNHEPSPDRTAAQVAQQMLNEISKLLDGRPYDPERIERLTNAFSAMVHFGALGITDRERQDLLEIPGVANLKWAREVIERLNVLR